MHMLINNRGYSSSLFEKVNIDLSIYIDTSFWPLEIDLSILIIAYIFFHIVILICVHNFFLWKYIDFKSSDWYTFSEEIEIF